MSCNIFLNRCSQEKPIVVMQVIRTIFVELTKMILSALIFKIQTQLEPQKDIQVAYMDFRVTKTNI